MPYWLYTQNNRRIRGEWPTLVALVEDLPAVARRGGPSRVGFPLKTYWAVQPRHPGAAQPGGNVHIIFGPTDGQVRLGFAVGQARAVLGTVEEPEPEKPKAMSRWERLRKPLV